MDALETLRDDRFDADAVAFWEVRNLGLGERAVRNEASSVARQAQYRQVALLDQVAREVAEAHAQVVQRKRRIDLAQDGITAAEKSLKLNLERIENAQGLNNVNEIAQASPRIETIIFGPADFMASINMKSLVVGEQPPGYPADAYHYILMKILMAARANDLQAIDGPYLQIRNVDGYREVARRAAALGFDGKWVLHPGQVEASNEIFSPSQEDYDHAELILDAYDWCTSEAGGAKGSAMLGDEMIDEASRKMALVIAAKGRAAGMPRTSKFEPPQA